MLYGWSVEIRFSGRNSICQHRREKKASLCFAPGEKHYPWELQNLFSANLGSELSSNFSVKLLHWKIII